MMGTLRSYSHTDFDVNAAGQTGIVRFDGGAELAFAKWVTPKRTRSYPFARLYDILSFAGKRVAIIPVIKDEGLGSGKNKSNNDRINFITLSWMNLANVYILLAWYAGAKRKSPTRITAQRFDSTYVREKLRAIAESSQTSSEWNEHLFKTTFVDIYGRAVQSYIDIGRTLGVEMHPPDDHYRYLQSIQDSVDKSMICRDRFAELSLERSKSAARRELEVSHRHEVVKAGSRKGIFEIWDGNAGRYFLTSDEIEIDAESGEVRIQEAKNSSGGKIPGIQDVKDGLFKILLFSQMKVESGGGERRSCRVTLKLTGGVRSSINLPADDRAITEYCQREGLTASMREVVVMVNAESRANGFTVFITSNNR